MMCDIEYLTKTLVRKLTPIGKHFTAFIIITRLTFLIIKPRSPNFF